MKLHNDSHSFTQKYIVYISGLPCPQVYILPHFTHIPKFFLQAGKMYAHFSLSCEVLCKEHNSAFSFTIFFFYFSQTRLNSPFKTQCICCFTFLLLFPVLVNKTFSFRSICFCIFQKVLTSKLGQVNKDLMLFYLSLEQFLNRSPRKFTKNTKVLTYPGNDHFKLRDHP